MEDQLKTMFSKSGTNAAKARLALDPRLFGSEFVDLLKSRENALRGSSASKPTVSSKQLTTSGRLSKRWLANSPPELSCPFRAKPRSSRRARRRGSSGSARRGWTAEPRDRRSSQGRPTHDGARHAYLAAGQYRPFAAQLDGDRRRQSVRVQSLLG